MPDYRVIWHIGQLDADAPVGAALEALAIHRDPDSIAAVFDVHDSSGARYRVDLDEHLPVPVIVRAPSTTPRRRLIAWFADRLISWAGAVDCPPPAA
ncbi:hypothetical protein [Nocardia brasiliensis]|uniref:hypothetical protein n=1 Tax=Nocardia brasiliensis TaxID=37326 RepID=UPI002454AB2D|nr:hypothetical protein [Nocardia brasiliensis]